MTTENITEEAEAARAALGKLAGAVHKRRREVLSRREGLQKQRVSVVVGSRAAMRAIDDADEVLAEEEDQLFAIVNGPPSPAPEPPAPAPQPEPPAPVEQPPAAPPVPAPEPTPTPPAPAPVDPPTVPTPAVPPAPPAPHVLDVRHWTGMQWLLALLGLVIGLVVAANTWHPLFGDIHGFGRGLATTVWWIFLPALVFGSFGWVGFHVDRALRRWRRRPQS